MKKILITTTRNELGWNAYPVESAQNDVFSGWGRTKEKAIEALRKDIAEILKAARSIEDDWELVVKEGAID